MPYLQPGKLQRPIPMFYCVLFHLKEILVGLTNPLINHFHVNRLINDCIESTVAQSCNVKEGDGIRQKGGNPRPSRTTTTATVVEVPVGCWAYTAFHLLLLLQSNLPPIFSKFFYSVSQIAPFSYSALHYCFVGQSFDFDRRFPIKGRTLGFREEEGGYTSLSSTPSCRRRGRRLSARRRWPPLLMVASFSFSAFRSLPS